MIESGSFRDPTARVFYQDGRVLRGLAEAAARVDGAARETGLMARLVGSGLFVDNWVVDDVKPPDGVPGASVVESKRLATVNYPSEWSFSMLQDAAIATLDANLMALESRFILKDASAFNIVFTGVRPVIIDVASLDRFGERGIWTAYGQFCDHFLAPLMLEAYTGLPFQRMLNGIADGIPIGALNHLLRGRAGIHKGILSHVRLRTILERRAAGMGTTSRREVSRASLPASAVANTIRKMRDLVGELESSASSTWASYQDNLPYQASSIKAKEQFVASAAKAAEAHDVAVDVGANAGRFTRLLSEHFDQVLGVDNDQGAVDALYAETKRSGITNLTPLVVDITNPTPSFGWRGRERAAFTSRVKPDFATWLAVVHHLCLSVGIPLAEVISLVYEFSNEAVVEFVAREDPMAQKISASRVDDLGRYDREYFEELVLAAGVIVASEQLSATRTAYHLRRK
jgi:hypothetical protein